MDANVEIFIIEIHNQQAIQKLKREGLTHVKSIFGSTETRGPKAPPAKEKTEG